MILDGTRRDVGLCSIDVEPKNTISDESIKTRTNAKHRLIAPHVRVKGWVPVAGGYLGRRVLRCVALTYFLSKHIEPRYEGNDRSVI